MPHPCIIFSLFLLVSLFYQTNFYLKKQNKSLRLNELAAELSFAQLSPNWRGLWIAQIQRGQRAPGLRSVISSPPALDL